MTGRSSIDQNVEMSGSAVTPPKGRATRARNDVRGRSSIGSKLQWTLALAVALVVLGAIFYFGRDVRSDYNGAGTSSPAIDVPALVLGVRLG